MSFLNVNVDDNQEEQEEELLTQQQQQLELTREHVRILSEQNEQLQSELQQLKSNVATVHQLSTYQNALAISESHKQSIQDENQRLRAENSTLRMKLEELGVNLDPFGVDNNDDHDDDHDHGTHTTGVISMDHIMGGAAGAGAGGGTNHHQMEDGSTNVPPPLDITTEEALAAIEHHHVVHDQHDHHQQHNDDDDDDVHHHHHKDMMGLSATSRAEERWERHLVMLEKYKQEHGNCLVPTNTELGRWLSRQRNNHVNNTLKEDRRRRLEEIDSTCLGERVTELRTMHPVTGSGSMEDAHTTMTTMAQQEEGMTLDTHPSTAATNATNATTTHGITIQNKTKYNQEYEGKLHEKWNVFFTQLVEFKNKTGHANFPTMHGSLGRWISRQRTLYRQSKLKADRYEKLKDIGFMFEDATADEFQNKNDQAWLDMFRQLEEHKQKKGHCFDISESSKLGKWLYRQRWMYRKGNLRDDRAEKLLAIGFEERKYDHASAGKSSVSSKKVPSSSSKKGQESATKNKRRRTSEDEETSATVGEEAAV